MRHHILFSLLLHLHVSEVLALMDFEGMMGDEMTVQVGDVVTSVTKPSEEGWLEGELRGKRGIFPANFVKVQCVHQEFAFSPSIRMNTISIQSTKEVKLNYILSRN